MYHLFHPAEEYQKVFYDTGSQRSVAIRWFCEVVVHLVSSKNIHRLTCMCIRCFYKTMCSNISFFHTFSLFSAVALKAPYLKVEDICRWVPFPLPMCPAVLCSTTLLPLWSLDGGNRSQVQQDTEAFVAALCQCFPFQKYLSTQSDPSNEKDIHLSPHPIFPLP